MAKKNLDHAEVIEEITPDVLKELSGGKLSFDSKFLDLSEPHF